MRPLPVVLLINIVVSVGIPLIINLFQKDKWDRGSITLDTVLALALFITFTAVEILIRLDRVYSLRTGEVALWKDKDKTDHLLSDIRGGLHEIIVERNLRNSFFIDHYQRELGVLRSQVQRTITDSEVPIERHHIESTYVLLSLYEQKEHSVFRATAVCSDVGDTFDVTYQVYFREWMRRLHDGKVGSLRRLFLYSDPNELMTQNNLKLLAVHNQSVDNLVGKIVRVDDFLRTKADFFITDGVLDIGIFSNQLVYLGQTRHDADITGRFSKDDELIEKYTYMFDAVWDSSYCTPVHEVLQGKLDPSDMFNPAVVVNRTQFDIGHFQVPVAVNP